MTANAQADSPGTADKAATAGQEPAGATQPSFQDLIPAVADAPKGEVTLGDKAGAFGPWRAHHVIDEIARTIAGQAVRHLGHAGAAVPRVLVVEDRLLLPGDWTAQYVRSTLDRMKNRLTGADGQLDEQTAALTSALEELEEDETAAKQAAHPEAPQAGGARRSLDLGTAADAAGSAAPPEVPSGALGAAVNLLGLLRTDYTITATAVSATPSELSTLTAAHLARRPPASDGGPPTPVEVEADAFAVTGPSPTADLFREVLGLRDGTVLKLSGLQALLAPVQAELTAIGARTTSVEQAWAAAMADKKDGADMAALRAALDALAEQSNRREKAIAAAVAAAAYAQQAVTDIDTATAALLQASGTGGEAPLYTAVRNERIGQAVASRKITHVLYVSLDAIAADAVTRRSILGTSGRLRFLSAGNASWLLLDTAAGAIAGGGQESLADVVTFSLETGQVHLDDAGTLVSSAAEAIGDPLDRLEIWAKVFVAVLAAVLFVLGVLSVIALVKVAFR